MLHYGGAYHEIDTTPASNAGFANPAFLSSASLGGDTHLRAPGGNGIPSTMSSTPLPTPPAPPQVSQQQLRSQAIASADSLVEEYLVYRGFTQSFRALQGEKASDKLKSLDVTKIAEQTFAYIHAFDMDNFVALWDFLTQRFFQHLDQEYVQLAEDIRADLLRYYLVNAKRKKPSRLHEFFAAYSHEILAESGAGPPLRAWYVLPYVAEPEKDPEFAPYFTARWADMLHMSLFNLLSVIIKTAPTPRLLLIDKWVHSESQQSLRNEVRASLENIQKLESQVKHCEHRIHKLHAIIRDMALFIHKRVTVPLPISSVPKSVASNAVGAVEGGSSGGSVSVETVNDKAERRRARTRKAGEIACLITQECYDRNAEVLDEQDQAVATYDSILDVADIDPADLADTIKNLSLMSLEELESNLGTHLADWLQGITK